MIDDQPIPPDELRKLQMLDDAVRAKWLIGGDIPTHLVDSACDSNANILHELNEAYLPNRLPSVRRVPESIGKYTIRSVIGIGGSGIVYLADDSQLRRVVAVKVPLPGKVQESERVVRFVTEMKAMARLDHPNIVPVYDAGFEDGNVYLVLAFCSGPSLESWLKSLDRPMAPDLAAKVLKMLANAIEYSHRQGIIHRDLKPGNILLFDDLGSGMAEFPYLPKITDFGLAKLLDDNELQTASLQIQGTPQYMAPEQLVQGKRLVTVAIDIYALGVLLYRMLVGRTPFQFESIEDAVRKIEFQRPVAPHVIQSNVSRDLSLITMKCLEKKPQDRYLTAGALAEDLDNYLHGRPVRARAPSLVSLTRHWCRQHPVSAFLLGATAFLLTIFGALEYRYARNLLSVNRALEKSQTQLLDQDRVLQEKVRLLNQSLETSEGQQRELMRRDEHSKQLIYVADVSAAARAISEQDPNRALRLLAPYFSQKPEDDVKSIAPEFAAKYLWSHLRPRFRAFQKDSQSLWTVAVSPDGKTIATAGSEGNIVLHDPDEGVETSRVLRSEPFEINSLCYSRDGRLLAAARDDGVIAIWDAANDQLVRTIKAISGEAYVVRFLGNSHKCAVAGRGNEILIWDADTGEWVRSLPVTIEYPVIECLDVSEDGTVFAVGGTDGYAHVLDAQGESLWSFRSWSHSTVNAVCLVPSESAGSYSLVIADKLRKLTLCDPGGGESRSLSVHDPIQAIVHLGGGLLLCGDKGGSLLLVEMVRKEGEAEFVDLRILHQWANHDAAVQAIAIERRADDEDTLVSNPAISRALNRELYTVSRSGDLYNVDLRHPPTLFPARRVSESRGMLTDCEDVEEDGSLVCQVSKGRIVWIEVPSGKRHSVDAGRRELTAVARVPGTSLWMVGDKQGEVATVDWNDRPTDPRDIAWKTVFKEAEFAELKFHPNDRWVSAIGGFGGFPLKVFDPTTGTAVFEAKECRSVAFSKDGQRTAIGKASSNHVEVLDTGNWEPIATLKKHRSTVHILEFSDDNQWLVSCSDDRMACFWDTATWELRDTLVLPGTQPTSMTLSPDSRTLVVCDLAGRVILWDMKTRRELMVLKPEGPPVLKVKFVADGARLFAWKGNDEFEIFETYENPSAHSR